MSILNEMPPFPQGELKFVELLKKHEPFVPNWEKRTCLPEEADLTCGVALEVEFPDPEKLLDTAYSDFRRFTAEAGLQGDFPVKVRYIAGFSFEEYRLTVSESEISLEASDTEAVRRGIYYLMDQLSGSPFMKRGEVMRTPWLKNRISRCFFGPIKRPPFNIDELMNDIDYYPEEYLSRLAREGVNGLWLTVVFREICDTSVRPAPPEAARRIAKLRTTVERCRRYGIKIWTFCIEPIYWSKATGNELPPGCEELLGPKFEGALDDIFTFCVNSDKAKKYLYECTNYLFKSVPHLGGLLTISYGERPTSCLSTVSATSEGEVPCHRRCNLSIGEILAATLGSMKKGMEAANPEAELISWLYIPYMPQVSSWITKLPEKLENNVALAFNFESGVTRTQLGAVRTGGDYWLSTTGPADRFIMMAEAAKGKCDFAAKIQAACSHECATVPCIPAPGLLYRKYKKMRELNVKHVIQCWYFGNYPGIMNQAAGQLAYEDFSAGEEAFLTALARPEWGRDYAGAVEAWKNFADGYSEYPLDFQFQYYGPMHDGPVWPLSLKLAMKPLPRSWKPENFPAGDAVGEMMTHFELPELSTLTGLVSAKWHKGVEVLQKHSAPGHELDFTLAEALDIQFRSGHNILTFYAMRNALLDAPADSATLLQGMKQIVLEEIVQSRRLAELCRQDSRLGYHSEAEVYKYHPAKLEWRAKQLEELLAGDFAEAEKIIAGNGSISEFLDGRECAVSGKKYGTEEIQWSFDSDFQNVNFHIDLKGHCDCREMAFLFFMDRKGARRPPETAIIHKEEKYHTADGWHIDISIPRAKLSYEPVFFFGIERLVYTADGLKFFNDSPGEYLHEPRLNLGFFGVDKLRKVRV